MPEMMKPVFLLAVIAMMAPASAFGMAKAADNHCVTSSCFGTSRAGETWRQQSSDKLPQWRRRHLSHGKQLRSVNLHMSLSSAIQFRGGASVSLLESAKNWNASPSSLFNSSLLAVAMLTAVFKVVQRAGSDASNSNASDGSGNSKQEKPKSVKELQIKFLSVFWLLRCADWLQGPYFYEVYASKIFNGQPAPISLISRLFLTGFASTALFGPLVGRAVDSYGRKRGTLAFSVIYAVGALSTKSPLLWMLFFGRLFSGIGTSLLFSAPESWLVGESQKNGDDSNGKYLGETFGLAYAGDSIVAILAGQLAAIAASQRGPSGPFELSTGFLALGGLSAAVLWHENVAAKDNSYTTGKPSIKDAIQVVKDDPKIMLIGGVQSLFEAAMYIFVLQWPPAISRAITKSFGDGATTPFGTVFSCFMACCLFGSTLFGQLAKMKIPTESFTAGMLAVATLAMSLATYTVSSSATMALPGLVFSFFAFEACVGMYFPSIGTLRSKYIPDSHRSVIMNLFGIPLNVLVVSVFLSISKLGLIGALGISSAALGLATICMTKLASRNKTSS
jgi:MFS family permease